MCISFYIIPNLIKVYILAEQVQKARDDLALCCSLNPSFASALAQKLYVDFRYGVRFEDVALINEALDGFVQAQAQFPKSSEICSLYAQVKHCHFTSLIARLYAFGH